MYLSSLVWFTLAILAFAAIACGGECQIGGPVFLPDYRLPTFCRSRDHVEYVRFPRSFDQIPQIAVALTGFDFTADTSVRVHVTAEGVTQHGFNLRFYGETGSNVYVSCFHHASAMWTACT
ncbi:unnamed protein product [Rotaria sordida]|uniref:H-type lectin domain-containing protein n=1 Tax=Rotaria sordida TaxID=392033 RepID=A0A814A8N5_9BILA|nr:unnamed protein product [Rotaria sordida]CAF0908447.1 unnamed protein product [Rotaria sordida]CAF0975467.1 unnamed protein product [Rotaria sordida]CAF0994924.1 unnamed protein product [Rotaria sordida]CAF1285235.1 unnamed protein product [Rotaria sordida]